MSHQSQLRKINRKARVLMKEAKRTGEVEGRQGSSLVQG